MELLAIVVVLGLAVAQTVDVLHHSRLFYSLQTRAAAAAETSGVPAFLGQLYSCPYCLSHWVAFALTIIYFATSGPLWWLVVALAVTRAANMANDLYKPFNHMVRHEPDIGPTTESED